MTTPLRTERPAESRLRAPTSRTGPLLVATDGSPECGAALGAGFLLAGQLAADVEVIVASRPLPSYGPNAPAPELQAAVDEQLLSTVRKQVRRSMARDAEWPIHLLRGAPADVIAQYAKEHDARLILLGRGPRDLRHRVFGGTLAMRLAQLSDVPILSVASPFHTLPRRVLVALDFGPRSLEAARDALTLTSEVASVYLAHVVPKFETALGLAEDWQASYTGGLEEAFGVAEHELRPSPTSTVETLTLHGDPARELLTAAAQIDADLIVCGTHGAGYIQRTVLGSVATHILRAATCSVLLVPNAKDGEGEPERAPKPVEQAVWTETLRRFTEHNSGRRAIMEVDDPTIGAQAQVVDYPFLGAAYDPHTQRADLMLGGHRAGRPHLTHSIGNVRSIDVMEGGDGRDRVLRVAHDGGQTLLTLTT